AASTTDTYILSLHDALPILEVFARAARWTISGVGLSLFPASGRFNFHLERPGRRHRSAGLSLLDQPSGRSAPGPFRLQHISLARSEEHTSELQSPDHLVCRL